MRSGISTLFWVVGLPFGALILFLCTHVYYDIVPGEEPILFLLTMAALGALSIGIAVLTGIYVSTRIAANDRKRIVKLFPRGLLLTQLALSIQVLLIAFMMAASLYLYESLMTGRVHIWIVGSLALGGIYGAMITFGNATNMGRPVETWVSGHSVSESDAPDLWRRVRELSAEIGGHAPENILVGFEPNFFVTEARVRSLAGQFTGRTMYCSLSLMRMLTPDEFCAVISHELAHFKGEDTVFSSKFYPVYRGAYDSAVELHKEGNTLRGIVLQPAIAVLEYFLESFATVEAGVGRARELEADRQAALIAGNKAMASSLAKVHVASEYWGPALEKFVTGIADGGAPENPGDLYAKTAVSSFTAEHLASAASKTAAHPTDSHPPLGVRLESLGVSADEIALTAADFSPQRSAAAFAVIPDTEEKLTKAHQIQLDAYIKALRQHRAPS